jgi:predicted phage terminase large subunit-like protein
MLQSWDMAFKDLNTSDYVVGGVWASKQADRFLLDQKRDRLNFPSTVEAVKAMSEKWPQVSRKLIEDKANGTAVIASLQHKISGLIPVNPEGGKTARAQAVSPQVESGNVYLPHPAVAPWVDGFIEECAVFPNGRHDDQVDQCTQALNFLIGGPAFGLFSLWKEQAEQIAKSVQPTSLASAQKSEAEDWTRITHGKFGKPKVPPAPPVCFNCGNTAVSSFAESWHCGACGASGKSPAR